MKKFLLTLALLLTGCAAQAQWQVPTNSIPLGRGPGVTGFATVGGGGGTGTLCLVDSVPPAFNTCPGGGAGATIPNNTVLGNVSGSTALPTGLTTSQLTTLCVVFTTSLKGCVPASGGGTVNFLRADATFAPIPADTPTTVLYTAAGTGAIASQTLQSVLARNIYLTDYATCNGTDETTAIQNAINQAVTVGGTLILPGGAPTVSCSFTGTLTISGRMTMQGQGRNQSMVLGSGTATQAMINVTSNDQVTFKDFWLNTTTANKTGGYGIQFSGGGGSPESDFAVVERVNFTNHKSALNFVNAAYFSVKNCIFQLVSNSSSTQVNVTNGASGDAGDSELVSNWFIGGFSNTTYVYWGSSGGLRVRGNKFLGNGTAGIMMNINPSTGIGTGLISVIDNSFDGPQNYGINFNLGAASNTLTNITISGNRFDGSPASPFIYMQRTAGSTLGAININGNNFTGPAATGVQAATVDTILVNDNVFGGITAAVVINSAGAAIVNGNLLGGGTLAPSSTSATVTIGTNK